MENPEKTETFWWHRLTAYATVEFFVKILLKNFQSETVLFS